VPKNNEEEEGILAIRKTRQFNGKTITLIAQFIGVMLVQYIPNIFSWLNIGIQLRLNA